jgi:hypothetical protein
MPANPEKVLQFSLQPFCMHLLASTLIFFWKGMNRSPCIVGPKPAFLFLNQKNQRAQIQQCQTFRDRQTRDRLLTRSCSREFVFTNFWQAFDGRTGVFIEKVQQFVRIKILLNSPGACAHFSHAVSAR